MRIAIGSDHRGFAHKERLLLALEIDGHTVADCGCRGPDATDYPDAAFVVAGNVADGAADAGILICGSGIGMSITANKVAGVRASLCCDLEAARTTRRHNDSNVMCLSGDHISPDQAVEFARQWLDTEFEGGRHGRRVDKITAYEAEHWK